MLRRVILLPDFHYPHIDESSVNAVFKFIKWFRPHDINIIGDGMNMDAVNHWKRERGDEKYFEGKRLSREYKDFDADIITRIESVVSKGCKKTYMGGNHEDWVNSLVERNPQLEGLVEPEIKLNLKKRGWKWIPWIIHDEANDTFERGITNYGKLLVFHGQYTNKYHSAKTADTYSKSCAYAHSHDIQLYTKVTIDDYKGYHTAQSIGCLCNRSPEFLRGKMNRWVNAFGIVYVRGDGNFNLYVPVIVKGKFVFEGKVFNGNY